MDHSYGGSGRRPPHITVNSGSGGDILNPDNISSASDTGTPSTSRNLIPPPRPPTSGSQQSRMAAPQVYGSPDVAQSNEMLLPPTRSRSTAANNNQSYSDYPMVSPSVSGFSSRRTSWSSEAGSRDSRLGPFGSPFDDSRASSRAGDSDDENINTQTVSEKYNIMPSAGLLLFPEDVEKDDYLHNPDPNEKEPRCDICNRRGLVNVGGLVLITLATLALFIAYPVVTFAQHIIDPTNGACAKAADCLSDKVALLKNVRMTLVDPDTPESAQSKTAQDGTKLKLVFSDEFNTDGRTFYDGDDPYFQAMDMWYGATQDLEWYDPDAVTTGNGTLNIKFDAFQSHNLNYRSGMLQSWNKLCFKGGRVEASISLPGRGDWPGFWPGFWAMGNLARPGYQATTEGMWPYSYSDTCDIGITANQSSSDGMSWLPGMKLPACTCKGQEHPSAGKSRSAPEIDALEASVDFIGPGAYDKGTGSASQSYQIAPFDIFYLPDYNYFEVYDNEQTGMSGYHGGNYQQAMSAVTWLNNDWYDGKGYQTYGFEYTPGSEGTIAWFVGDQYTWKLDSRALRPNGNVGQRTVPEEPMALIMNLGMGTSFSQVMMPNLNTLFPATMRFDYIRIYQEEGSESITCDPEGYPTTEYIKNHPEPYDNVNLTSWEGAGYSWPTNSFVHGC